MSDQNEKSSPAVRRNNGQEAEIKQKLGLLKEELILQKEQVKEIKDLIKKEIETHYKVDLWELSPKELDQEMGNLLSLLNEDINCLIVPEVASRRKRLGIYIGFMKRVIKRIIRPILELYLEKQSRFNEGAVRFQLASFIRFRRMEQKLEGIERMLTEIEEQQNALLDAIKSLSER